MDNVTTPRPSRVAAQPIDAISSIHILRASRYPSDNPMNEEVPSNAPDSKLKRPVMPTRLRITLWSGVLIAMIFWCFPDEPMHEGLTLSQWMEDIDAPLAGQAIVQAGTNGIPVYLKLLSAERSQFKDAMIYPLNKLPLAEIAPFTPEERQRAAFYAFHTLGTNARPAYPVLLELLKKDNCPYDLFWT